MEGPLENTERYKENIVAGPHELESHYDAAALREEVA